MIADGFSLQHLFSEGQNILGPLAQRRHAQSNYIEAIEKVIPETMPRYLRGQIAIGRFTSTKAR